MIGLSPLSPGHRRTFQRTSVRPSTGSYPRFSLPRDSSPGFASAARDWRRPFGTRSRSGSLPSLTSPRASNSLAHSTKGTPSHNECAPTPCGRTVSGTVSLPSRGAFHLSLTVLVRYRSHGSIQAWRVVPPDSDRVSRARPYSGPRIGCSPRVRLRGHNPVPPAFPCRSAPLRAARRARQRPGTAPCNPGGGKAGARARSPVWPSAPFRSPLLGGSRVDFLSSGYLDVSVPRVVPHGRMCSARGRQRSRWRVRPFGDPRVEGCVPLTADYRSLPRPSSAPCAKASAVRPAYLAPPGGGAPCPSTNACTVCDGCHTHRGGTCPPAVASQLIRH